MIQYYIMGIILLPGIILAIFAETRVTTSFNRWNSLLNTAGLTGEQIARRILDSNGLQNIRITRTNGNALNNYYDPRRKVIALSNEVANSASIAAVGVALHEVGHAIQYKNNYFPIKIRNFIIPISNFVSGLLWPLVIVGCLLNFWLLPNGVFGLAILWISIISFGLVVLFNLATLPVEYNASNRAIKILKSENILLEEELNGVKDVLGSAALTYVASLLIAILNFLRILFVFLSMRRND